MRIGDSEMNRPAKISSPRRPTNVSLPADLVEDAKRLGINVSQSCEEGLRNEVRKELGEKWKRENMDALESSNEYVRKHGLPLARHRNLLWRS
jgi:antitoxin CcdA